MGGRQWGFVLERRAEPDLVLDRHKLAGWIGCAGHIAVIRTDWDPELVDVGVHGRWEEEEVRFNLY